VNVLFPSDAAEHSRLHSIQALLICTIFTSFLSFAEVRVQVSKKKNRMQRALKLNNCGLVCNTKQIHLKT
jgi:hypothetical protein